MKQVTVVYRPKDLRGIGYDEMFRSMKRFTVISQIAMMPEKSAIMVVIKWISEPDLSWFNSSALIDKMIDMGPVHEGQMYLLLGYEEPWFFDMIKMIMEEMQVFFDLPIVLEHDRIVVRYIGFLENISKVMELSKQFNNDNEILSIKDYEPSQTGALEKLTATQFQYLEEAYEGGYFDDHRRITINQLAQKKGISPASYMKTLRRALRKMIGSSITKPI
jgi:DNA binding protein with HTH domain